MYFLPHKSKTFVYAVHTPRRYRYLFTIILSIILAAACYGAYWFLEQKMQTMQQSIQQLHQQFNQLCQSERACDIHKKHRHDLENQFDKYRFASQDNFTQQQLNDILHEAKKQNIRVNELTVIKQIDKKWYHQRDIQLHMAGSFENMMNMLTALKTNGHMIQCKQFSCQRTEGVTFSAQCQLRAISSPTLQDRPESQEQK